LPLCMTASCVAASGTTATFTVSATSGNFTLTYDGQTTASLAVGLAGAAVQTALTGLSSVHGAVTVNQAGSTYTVTIAGGDTSKLSGRIVLSGTVRRVGTPADFAAALQKALTTALSTAGLSGVT